MDETEQLAIRRLRAARLAGAGGLAVLAQFALDMPGGYFGPADTSTAFGLAYAGAVLLLVLCGAVLHLRASRWHGLVDPLFFALNIGVFIAPLATDPVLAGAVIVWHLVLAATFLFPWGPAARPVGARLAGPMDDQLAGWLRRNGPATMDLAGVSLLISVLVVGLEVGDRVPALLVTLTVDLLALAVSLPLVVLLLHRRRRRALVAAVFLGAALASAGAPALAFTLFAGYLLTVWFLVAVRTRRFRALLQRFYSRPAALVLASFVVLILLGTLFLSFPAASADRAGIAPIDALFTATSAACVTGLIVVDTPNAFSTFGHVVILLLIQIGGLNIMVLSTFAALLLGRELGLRGERAIGAILEVRQGRSAHRLIVFIVLTTLLVEAAGAVGLTLGFRSHGFGWAEAGWRGLFHAVSAFCNAGFALQSDSFFAFRSDPAMLLITAALITLGGFGFAFLAFLWSTLRGRREIGFTMQARLVLTASAVLTFGGALLIATAEWNRALAGLAPADKIVNAFFQSVVLRTAGFNSVPFESLHAVTVFVMMAMMFIGASPGGTGGGIKTTTAAVLFGAIPALARGAPRIVLFRRTMPLETVYRSAAIAVTGSLLILAAGGLLLATQDQPFASLLFETFSAFGTVGLSLGATAGLDALGKWVVIVLMLLGRIGPLTLALLLGREQTGRLGYPDARIMVG